MTLSCNAQGGKGERERAECEGECECECEGECECVAGTCVCKLEPLSTPTLAPCFENAVARASVNAVSQRVILSESAAGGACTAD